MKAFIIFFNLDAIYMLKLYLRLKKNPSRHIQTLLPLSQRFQTPFPLSRRFQTLFPLSRRFQILFPLSRHFQIPFTHSQHFQIRIFHPLRKEPGSPKGQTLTNLFQRRRRPKPTRSLTSRWRVQRSTIKTFLTE